MRAEYVHSSKDTTNHSTWGGWQFFTTVCSGDDIHTLAWGPAKATPPAPTAEQIKASAQARLDASLLEGIW
jgi:hypothetical protein